MELHSDWSVLYLGYPTSTFYPISMTSSTIATYLSLNADGFGVGYEAMLEIII